MICQKTNFLILLKLLTVNICSPLELQNVYTEQLAFTNHTIFVVDNKQKFSNLRQHLCTEDELERLSFNLPENVDVFCNFNLQQNHNSWF